MTAAASVLVAELVKQSLVGDDIKGFGEEKNTNVRLQALFVYGCQVVKSEEELGLPAEAGMKAVLEWLEHGHPI